MMLLWFFFILFPLLPLPLLFLLLLLLFLLCLLLYVGGQLRWAQLKSFGTESHLFGDEMWFLVIWCDILVKSFRMLNQQEIEASLLYVKQRKCRLKDSYTHTLYSGLISWLHAGPIPFHFLEKYEREKWA